MKERKIPPSVAHIGIGIETMCFRGLEAESSIVKNANTYAIGTMHL